MPQPLQEADLTADQLSERDALSDFSPFGLPSASLRRDLAWVITRAEAFNCCPRHFISEGVREAVMMPQWQENGEKEKENPCRGRCKCKSGCEALRSLPTHEGWSVSLLHETAAFHFCILISIDLLPDPEKETSLRSFVLRDLLPSSVDGYYRYTGSLTTPPCSKVVEWIIFSRPVYLSHSQVCEVWTHTHTDTQTAIFSMHSQIPFPRSQWITCCPLVPAHKQVFPLIYFSAPLPPAFLTNPSAY